MQNKSSVFIFLDEESQPFGEFSVPINFDLDTTKLVDGEHVLKIVSKDPHGKKAFAKYHFLLETDHPFPLKVFPKMTRSMA